MTTALPSWAYVWGRYLVGLLMSLGLATLLLVGILGTGIVLHLTVAGYPAPVIGITLLLWVGMVVPATMLVSSLSFAVVTLFPRLCILVKIVILVVGSSARRCSHRAVPALGARSRRGTVAWDSDQRADRASDCPTVSTDHRQAAPLDLTPAQFNNSSMPSRTKHLIFPPGLHRTSSRPG